MNKKGLLIISQLDHLSGEDIGWALESLNVPGVRNRNLIPTLTKKGRMGFLLLVDLDPAAEPEVARLLMDLFGTYGYHRMSTQHVHRRTKIEAFEIVVQRGKKSIHVTGRFKRKSSGKGDALVLESDDLFALHGRIREEWDVAITPAELRRRIETAVENAGRGRIRISLRERSRPENRD